MKTVSGAGKKSPNTLQRQRNGLLAIVHIAKQQLGVDDATYREMLLNWGVKSSAALSILELENLVDYFTSLGFQKRPGSKDFESGRRRMTEALHERIREEAAKLENGEARLTGLVKKIANVDDLRFCRNVGKLKQILKILGQLKVKEKS